MCYPSPPPALHQPHLTLPPHSLVHHDLTRPTHPPGLAYRVCRPGRTYFPTTRVCHAHQQGSGSSKAGMAAAEESYSLWVMPKGSQMADQLQREIEVLAASQPGSPVFPPHVTVLGDIKKGREQVVALVQQLAAKLKVWYGGVGMVCICTLSPHHCL